MSHDLFYAAITLCACGGLFLIWQLGYRKLFLEDFRDSVFVVRKRLYALAQDGDIDCNSEAYRSVESLLNGIIRYAHRFNLTSLYFSMVEKDRRRQSESYVDFSEVLMARIETVSNPYVRTQLKGIVIETGMLLAKYIARSSLAFMGFSLVFYLRQEAKPKQRAVSTFEREAYYAYESDGNRRPSIA